MIALGGIAESDVTPPRVAIGLRSEDIFMADLVKSLHSFSIF